ncbi:molybdopterin molybdotransferase MoeA [Mucilaginibacter roseus]|uniref:Molybdopterin molybdenumtransferase n=1 Tax=Mucilaginibacter roseus TaxID=1528868 RepID=A0ABS8U260_9SPHI|nr:molybdopterin molybdotransferase MoeA [Mucilaginibacter roseus]MCD8740133.1 molybdopterin molybdotransferase MoeA [Mucilaginibacter roseus]
MITVEQAEQIILDNKSDLGAEITLFDTSAGRVLAETIRADRDLPPYNRVMVDGIAIKYSAFERGIRIFKIKAVQAAGVEPVEVDGDEECIEIMTGAAIPESVDTVIRYEDITIGEGEAIINLATIEKGQGLHLKGADKTQGDVLAVPGQLITPAVLSLIASVGEAEVRVKKVPRIVVISTGDEVIEVHKRPTPFQIRRSNNYTAQAILKTLGYEASVLHLPDDPEVMRNQLSQCFQYYDAIILAGGVSAGKFDFLPQVLNELGVEQLFHKVAQRPGKPFWFGKHGNGVPVFAFPGNPVAVYMCLHRYFIPWLYATLGQQQPAPVYAMLNNDLEFKPELKYFLQVKLLVNEQAKLIAEPIVGNGSGDFANLADANAFMELPAEKSVFKKGEVYRVHLINPL